MSKLPRFSGGGAGGASSIAEGGAAAAIIGKIGQIGDEFSEIKDRPSRSARPGDRPRPGALGG